MIDKETAVEEGPRGRARTSASRWRGRSRRSGSRGIVQFSSGLTIGGATLAGFDLPTAQSPVPQARAARRDRGRREAERDRLQQLVAGDSPDPAVGRGGEDGGAAGASRTPPTRTRSSPSCAGSSSRSAASRSSSASFVIANSLSITIAQRTRELATLRTLGASRRQVLRSIIIEALVVGIARVARRPLLRARPREGAVRALRPGRLHPSEHRARVPHAHVRDRRAARRDPRDADREPAPCDPRDARSPDRRRARGARSSRLPSTDGCAASGAVLLAVAGIAAIAYGIFATVSGRSRS